MNVETDVSFEILYGEPFIRRDFKAIQRLINELYNVPGWAKREVTREAFQELTQEHHVVVARLWETGEIIGTASLVRGPKLSRLGYWIEDVVVDVRFRNIGIGKGMMQYLLLYADQAGIEVTDLKSSRPIAITMYHKLGFQQRGTIFMQRPRHVVSKY